MFLDLGQCSFEIILFEVRLLFILALAGQKSNRVRKRKSVN